MSPYWRREDNEALREARRVRVELAESASILSMTADRLLALAAELADEADPDGTDEGDRRGRD